VSCHLWGLGRFCNLFVDQYEDAKPAKSHAELGLAGGENGWAIDFKRVYSGSADSVLDVIVYLVYAELYS